MLLKDGQRVVFTGDSITDCGRGRPIGAAPQLGGGYVALVDALLVACRPECAVEILNTGISGNRVIDLDSRWQGDVLDLAPDWLVIMIGINDVWRQFDRASDPNQVPPERFEAVYRKLLRQACPRPGGLVLMTPYFIEPDRADPMRALMDDYGRLTMQLADEFGAVTVDVQAAFDRYLRQRPSETLSVDRVHPNQTGHMLIARAFLQAVQVDWSHAE